MSRPFEVGVKIYDLQWYLQYGLSYTEAAWLLRDWGVTFVLAQNRYLPMYDSAVASETRPEWAARLADYDDRRFRDALARVGIAYWPTVCMFFDPPSLAADPTLRPMGSDGRPMEMQDWYVGIAPSQERFVAAQIAAIERAVRALEPEGVFMSFTRWPGFWELWMPHHTRARFPEYSYDAHTLELFEQASSITLPTHDPAPAAAWIETHARDAWSAWKCNVVADVLRQVKAAGRRICPDLKLMLNSLPFGNEFDNAQEKVFGQRIETLSGVVDRFEVMTYHQILKRPVSWIPQIGAQIQRRSGRQTVCTLQARPLYLDGMHAPEQRANTLDASEFAAAIDAVEEAGLDGIVVFVWSDLLAEGLRWDDMRRVAAIRAASARRAARQAVCP